MRVKFSERKKGVMAIAGHAAIVVESKVCAATYSTGKDAPFFLVRADPVAEALAEALEALGLRYECRSDVMARKPGDLAQVSFSPVGSARAHAAGRNRRDGFFRRDFCDASRTGQVFGDLVDKFYIL